MSHPIKVQFLSLAGVLALILTCFPAPVGAQQNTLTRADRAMIRFMEGMIDHHQMALDMAADCLNKATTDAVLEICQNVIAAQTPEIELMQGWLLDD